MSELIQASFSACLVKAGKPKKVIQYIPPGSSQISATVNGSPAVREVHLPSEKGEEVAAAFQRDLELMQNSNILPFIDFYHEGKAKGAIPKRFAYSDKDGLTLEIEHTAAGKTEIEGGNVDYFSPEFMLGAEGVPLGLNTSQRPIGGFVSDPAFDNIARIAASKARNPNLTNMAEIDDLKKQIAELKAAQADNVSAAKAKLATDKLKADLVAAESARKELEVEVTKQKEAEADALIADAVKAGKIAPKADKIQASYKKIILADKEEGQALLEALPAQNQHVKASHTKTANTGTMKDDEDKDLVSQCKELIQAGKAKNYREASRILGTEAVTADRVKQGLCNEDIRKRFETTEA